MGFTSFNPSYGLRALSNLLVLLMAKKNYYEQISVERWLKKVGGKAGWATRHTFQEDEFKPYYQAIGELLLVWNDLHECLSALFIAAVGGGWVNRPLALWHSIRNDLGKRQMLKAAIEEIPPSEIGSRTKIVEEIKWILTNTNKLEGLRDDAVHTPLYFWPKPGVEISVGGEPVKRMVQGYETFGNRRAQRINESKSNFLADLRHGYNRLVILRDYAFALDIAWSNERLPWPDRPQLPNPSPKKKRSPVETRNSK